MKYRTVIIITMILSILSSCNRMRCPDGTKVIVERHPEKQYDSYVKTTNVNVKATIDILEKVKIGDLTAETKNMVTNLRQDLDQISIRTQELLKTSFASFSQRPCDKEISKRHFDLLDNVSKENVALEQLRTELEKVINSGNVAGPDDSKIKSLINEYKAKEPVELSK